MRQCVRDVVTATKGGERDVLREDLLLHGEIAPDAETIILQDSWHLQIRELDEFAKTL
jgi:hypothetical protein